MSSHTAKFDMHKIRKIRDTIPSVQALLEQLRRDPNNTALGKCIICVYACMYSKVWESGG